LGVFRVGRALKSLGGGMSPLGGWVVKGPCMGKSQGTRGEKKRVIGVRLARGCVDGTGLIKCYQDFINKEEFGGRRMVGRKKVRDLRGGNLLFLYGGGRSDGEGLHGRKTKRNHRTNTRVL